MRAGGERARRVNSNSSDSGSSFGAVEEGSESLLSKAEREEDGGPSRDEAFMLLVELLCLRKRAFEARDEGAALEFMRAIEFTEIPGELPSQEARWIRKLAGLTADDGSAGDAQITALWTSDDGSAGDAQITGRWVDKKKNFFHGCAIDIKADSWRIIHRNRLPPDGKTKFLVRQSPPSQLVKVLPNGDERVFNVALDEHGMLAVALQGSGLRWTLQRLPANLQLESFSLWYEVIGEIDAETMLDIIDLGGQLAHRFLSALSVKVPNSKLKGREMQYESHWESPVQVEPGNWDGGSINALRSGLEAVAPYRSKRPLSIFRNVKGIRVQVYFSGARHQLDLGQVATRNQADLKGLAAALSMASDASTPLLSTPVGQAVLTTLWTVAYPNFEWACLGDLVFVFYLVAYIAPLSHRTRVDHSRQPDTIEVVLLALHSLRRMTIIGAECRTIRLERRWSKSRATRLFEQLLKPFTLYSMSAEFFVTIWVGKLCFDTYFEVPHESTLFYRKPHYLAFIILWKWSQVSLATANLQACCGTLVPAWRALMSPASVAYLCYLMVLMLGTAVSYIGYPMQGKEMTSDNKWVDFMAYLWPTSLKMFRLNVLGDFSMSELEGTSQKISKMDYDGNLTFSMEDNEAVHEIVISIRGYVMLLILVFPVVFLNVYIGVVSEAYSKAKENLAQTTGSFRIEAIFRSLLQRSFWSTTCFATDWIADGFDRIGRYLDGRPPRDTRADAHDGHGIWIVIPESLVQEPPS